MHADEGNLFPLRSLTIVRQPCAGLTRQGELAASAQASEVDIASRTLASACSSRLDGH